VFDRQLRLVSTRILTPLVRGPLASANPSALTVLGGVMGVAAAGAAARSSFLLALGLWLANRLIDGLDGLVARSNGGGSDAGGYLDMTVDVAVYALLPLGVAAGVDQDHRWVAAALLLASFYFNTITWTYLSSIQEKWGRGAAATAESTAITMPVGLVEGAETIVFFTFMLSVPSLATATMFAMAALVTFGATYRFVAGWRQIQ